MEHYGKEQTKNQLDMEEVELGKLYSKEANTTHLKRGVDMKPSDKGEGRETPDSEK